ncbi:hypothetical protein SAMN04487848_2058 [Microbacterium sp. ru370.1]|uniref:hypothetical protein n=1 Tax=unclassified Microbacterium TaxID=2609290 RepID=UPI00088933D9|nr:MULTISPECIES: hypothetical protein [unclassified Microbacterium]SDO77704.1 hypothetical protein SAMN04487848_2058 [Microbacterium sp. ru370.1]SIT88940.1 hypothetical protein SAMN05880579_2053 [Microbacterium sp. RU1D]
MTLRLDKSKVTGVVIVCDECPHWSAFRFDVEEGWVCAVDHEQRVHPGQHQAKRAAHAYAATQGVRPI